MKTLHLHVAWALVALSAAAVAVLVTRRGNDSAANPAADSRSNAALRARVAELESQLARGEPTPIESEPALAATPKAAEMPELARPAAPPLGVEQIRALLKSGNRDDVARGIKEIDLLPDRAQKLSLLRTMVESGDRGLASRALPQLKKLGGPEAVELITAVLSMEGSSGTRAQAAMALGELGDASALPALQEAWRTGDVQVRAGVAVALDKFGQREPAQAMVQTLGGMLQSPDGGTREDAVDILTHTPLPGSFPLLVAALGDQTNNHLREDAADAMGARKMTEALPFLEKALQDPSPNVRSAAQKAISQIKGTKP